MRAAVYAFLRFLIKVALHGYFKKITIQGKENIPSNQPLILVANHQNALLDPLVLATHISLNPYFLTRASSFKHPIAAALLRYIRMIPVYRLRDGIATLAQNQQTFDQTFDVLRSKGSVLIFAEGDHSIVRNVRPLSKGFTRMAFGVMERFPEVAPIILPIGIEYSAHKRSGSQVHIRIGHGIPVDITPAQSGQLTKKVENALKSLVVNLPNENYPDTLEQLLDHGVDVCSKQEVTNFFEGNAQTSKKVRRPYLANKMMKLLHLPLYLIWLYLIQPKIEDIVFTGTFKFLIGLVLAVPYYLLLAWLSFQPGIGPWALTVLILGWITLLANENSQE
jgi:1-acyl-sn-glycerol-3-phosphate acyltransferase